MTLKEFVIANVEPTKYYQLRFPRWNHYTKDNVTCPFHGDGSRPNLSIALRNGGAHCHSASCGKRIGNIVHFESELFHISEELAAQRIYRKLVRPVISSKIVKQYKENLYESPQYILKIKKEMGLGLVSIRKFGLGFDLESQRITIPVYDSFGQCVNIRYYRLPSGRVKNEDKIYNLKGYGKVDLFPAFNPALIPLDAPILFMASEKETMLVRQDGFIAVCSTGGEGSNLNGSLDLFRERKIFLLYHPDQAGEQANIRMQAQFATIAKEVVPVRLPFKSKRVDFKDYADWRLKEKHEPNELRKLLGNHTSNPSRIGMSGKNNLHSDRLVSRPIDFPKLPPFHSNELFDIASISSRADLLNHRIKCHGVIAAKSPLSYSIPWKFQIEGKNGRSIIQELPIGRELLRFIRSGDHTIDRAIRGIIGRTNGSIKATKYLTAIEVEVIPTIVIDKDTPYVVQRCYYFGSSIEANVPYELQVIPTSEIRTQETIGIIVAKAALSKTIDRFDYSASNIANLSFFQPTEGEGVWDKLVSVATEVSRCYSRVYNRLDWTLSALLTWACPLGWRFPGEPELQRGWLNTLAIGDTETGKSKLAKALQKLFNCGVFVSGENCTFVGLVGGAIKMGGGQLMLRWGRIPLSDKQLVVLEELSGLSVQEIANMSDVRSSGIARLDKGGINSETNSRTRLLCLSNARSSKRSVSQHLQGVHAIQELIGHGEDIARFDLITTLTDREVSTDIINRRSDLQQLQNGIEAYIAPDQYQKLIHFIWALTPDQIQFEQSAYEECLNQTKRLSSIYHPSIPIFKGGSGRYKLGRIAAAIACFQFAWNIKTNRIIINTGHVQSAVQLLELIYRKPSFGYAEYSRQMYDRETIKDVILVRSSFRKDIPSEILPKVIDSLIHATRFSRDELTAIAGLTTLVADRLVGLMLRERVTRKGEANQWDITPAGKLFFEDFLQRLQTKTNRK